MRRFLDKSIALAFSLFCLVAMIVSLPFAIVIAWALMPIGLMAFGFPVLFYHCSRTAFLDAIDWEKTNA